MTKYVQIYKISICCQCVVYKGSTNVGSDICRTTSKVLIEDSIYWNVCCGIGTSCPFKVAANASFCQQIGHWQFSIRLPIHRKP